MLPLFKSRCGWCHQRDTIIDWLIEFECDRGGDRFYRIVRWFDKRWSSRAERWHKEHH